MALPSILRIRKHHSPSHTPVRSNAGSVSPTNKESTQPQRNVTRADLKRSTRLRRVFVAIASFSYLLSWVFLILVVVGNTSDKPVLNDIYFFKLILADIIPMSVANASLINSIAQSIGLHDFYQIGLWNFCEGYDDVGITSCSKPQTLYWFNPVSVLMSELLAGATIALPSAVITILDILRITSQIMFGFFLTAALLTFAMIFLSPLALRSRWWSLPLAMLAAIISLLTTAASIVGSVISFVFKYAAESQSDLNISADVGVRMFVFMWLASGFAVLSFIVHAGMGCCCTSARDVKVGRRPVKESRAAVAVGSGEEE